MTSLYSEPWWDPEYIAHIGAAVSTSQFALYNKPVIRASAPVADITRKDEIMDLANIERLAKEFSTARELLSERVIELEHIIDGIKRRRLPGIKSAVNAVIEKQSLLKAAIEQGKNLFQRPKTIVMHGVKVGYQKAKGTVSWNDTDQVIKLIKKHLPDQADILIKTTEKPIKEALLNLSAADLKKIGVTVTNDSDQVVIKTTDSEIDKFVEALLKEDSEPKEAQEAA